MSPAPVPIPGEDDIKYNLIPTVKKFHECGAQKRCMVGPVGSGKTTGATWEVCYYLPMFIFNTHGLKKTRWVVVRNTSVELRDTTLKTVQEWFGFGVYKVQAMTLILSYPNGVEVEILFRACDNEKHVRQFKSLEVTGYWIDESIEVAESTKRMLKNRIGRYPRKSPVKFGIETTNPPDVEHPTYSQFDWGDTPPPGPVPAGKPLKKHRGFWQPPYENVANLSPNYYEDLKNDYADNPDWLEMYVEGKPGQLVRGKLVYDNFLRAYHVAKAPLIWSGQTLYRGWDNSGNTPAAVVVCPVSVGRLHVLREFVTVRENIVDFTNRVIEECNQLFPNGKFVEYGDPAGEAKYSTREGTFTSNHQLMADECGINVTPGEQNLKKRINSVDQALLRRDGMLIDPSCLRLINGFLGGYHYPELTNMPGQYKQEISKNKYSHCFVGDTLISTPSGPVQIKDLQIDDDIVSTPIGPRRVTATMNSISSDLVRLTFSDGSVSICTSNHPYPVRGRQVRADELQYGHVLNSINEGGCTWDEQLSMRFRSLTRSGTTRNPRATIWQIMCFMADAAICTGTPGSSSTARYLKGTASTILTKIKEITISPISNLKPYQTTLRITAGSGATATLKVPEHMYSSMLFQLQQRGIEVQKVLPGTVSTAKKHGKAESPSATIAPFVGRIMRLLEAPGRKDSARQHVRAKQGGGLESTISRLSALFVAKSSRRTSMPGNAAAQGNVVEGSPVRLLKREHLKRTERVYDLTVEEAHQFYANGILTSNCQDALQYVLTMLYVSAAPQVNENDLYPDEEMEPTY